ncbi:MAG: V-type ATP synthase subunit D [bacterium]|nr:V-type ATP synthase subunit D [bacterium]
MSTQLSPTKGNLMRVNKLLELSNVGFDLLDRKRNILIRQTLSLVDSAKQLRIEINNTYSLAYKALERANMSSGVIDDLAESVEIDNRIELSSKSIMGVELPVINYTPAENKNYFGYHRTSMAVNEAFESFNRAKILTVKLAEIESAVFKLADGLGKTQKRANALKNIIIPSFSKQTKTISSALEEREREEFSRLKIIKKIIDA